MKTYIAIGYFKHSKSQITAIIEERRTKIEMIQYCKENGFVAYLVLSDEQLLELTKMDDVDLVKTIAPLMHYSRQTWDVVGYLYHQCNSIKENI